MKSYSLHIRSAVIVESLRFFETSENDVLMQFVFLFCLVAGGHSTSAKTK